MFELKPLSPEGIDAALDKAEQYRHLCQPLLAESICLDVLEVDPQNQKALVELLLARTDQFEKNAGANIEEARALVPGLESEYERLYYTGIICERWAKGLLSRDGFGSGPAAYDWFRQAMTWYEKAEAIRPAGHDDAILRWNTCARMIKKYDLEPHHEDDFLPLLE